MTQEGIQRLQNIQLMIMDEIHRVCVENHLSYYMIGGTALGAIRHGGFIPWDMDIDIAMPREDYEEFISISGKALGLLYSCHTYKTNKNYHIPHAVVVLNNSSIKYKNDHLNPHIDRMGIYVDILPLDQSPDDLSKRLSQQKSIIRYVSFLEARFSCIYDTDSSIKRLLKKFRRLCLSVIPLEVVYGRLNSVMMKYDSIQCENWCSMVSHYSFKKLTMPKEIFGTPTLTPFAGREYYAPEKIYDYLTRTFGDYTKLPPEDVRLRQIESIVDASWPSNII